MLSDRFKTVSNRCVQPAAYKPRVPRKSMHPRIVMKGTEYICTPKPQVRMLAGTLPWEYLLNDE